MLLQAKLLTNQLLPGGFGRSYGDVMLSSKRSSPGTGNVLTSLALNCQSRSKKHMLLIDGRGPRFGVMESKRK